jgi:hypothetical protein
VAIAIRRLGVNSYSETPSDVKLCPFCSNPLEQGCIMGDYGRLHWVEGEPSILKNSFKLGEEVGLKQGKEPLWKSLLMGPKLIGNRCPRCRKMILDY